MNFPEMKIQGLSCKQFAGANVNSNTLGYIIFSVLLASADNMSQDR
jgi:hypothetical protein